MATINYSLRKIAENLFIKYGSSERLYIDERVKTFKTSIKDYFKDKVTEVVIFGSYNRDTILPRDFDEESDIDVLVVFNQAENERTPETYRRQLQNFAKERYFNTKVIKDHPSVVLEMKNIKFDLVPCRLEEGFWSDDYQIPDKDGSWMDTDPEGFTETLTKANTRYGSIVKPIIRLLKCWNAYVGYPYPSFELEQIIADMNFNNENYETGFIYAINNLPTDELADYQARKVESLQKSAEWIEEYLKRGNQEKALEYVDKILGIE